VTRTRAIAQAGLVAAVYAALTLAVTQVGGVFAWGPLQFRPSEAFTVVAALTPAAIPGLWLGAVLANLATAAQVGAIGLLDVVFGSLGSLLGAMWTWRFRRNTPLALLGPVLANALIVPAYLPLMLRALGGLEGAYTLPGLGLDARGAYITMYVFGVVAIAITEAVVVYGLGWPLLLLLRRLPLPGLGDERA
jgi:uncharacterized membrane protein